MSTLTETLRSNLDNPVSSSEFDLYTALDKVLSGVRLSAADSGGKIEAERHIWKNLDE